MSPNGNEDASDGRDEDMMDTDLGNKVEGPVARLVQESPSAINPLYPKPSNGGFIFRTSMGECRRKSPTWGSTLLRSGGQPRERLMHEGDCCQMRETSYRRGVGEE
jgi:hypothetical protein